MTPDFLQRAIYESPGIVMLGPMLSAIASGFAGVIDGHVFITPAGERYLEAVAAGSAR
jgi:hypothetical protein